MESFHWRQLEGSHNLYRYQSRMGKAQIDPASTPVLLIQPLPLEVGNSLAGMFRADGFTEIYSYPATADSLEEALKLADAVEFLLAPYAPQQAQIIVVGCGKGGVLGRRYMMLGGYERIAYLFTIGSSHRYSQLAYLRGSIFVPRDGTEPPPIAAPPLDSTVQVNLYGELGLDTTERAIQGIHLPDAVNTALPLGPEALCHDVLTYREIRRFLQGTLWLVTVRLQSLEMHGPADDELTGPFCFEVNGWRAPFDGAFRVPLNRRFDFEPARTLLGTITFPLTETGRAVDINFRLKDLSPPTVQRRKLFTSLHTPLRERVLSEHMLVDSLGSEVGIQVCCNRPESFLETDYV